MPRSLLGRGSDQNEGRSLNAHTECIRLVDGTRRPNPSGIREASPPSRRAQEARGMLYMLMEPPGRAWLPDALADNLLQLLTDTYYQSAGSVTRGLREALLAANTYLFEYNVRADADKRVILGVVCAVLRNQDLYMAQMGPAVTLSLHSDTLRQYPARSAWLDGDEPIGTDLDREPPLGLRRDAEPSLFHTSYEPGDIVLLASADLVRSASREQIATALTLDAGHLPAHLATLTGGNDVSALMIRPASAQSLQAASESQDAVNRIPDRGQTVDLSHSPSLSYPDPEEDKSDAESNHAAERADVMEKARVTAMGNGGESRDESMRTDDDDAAYADETIEDWDDASGETIRTRRPVFELGDVADTVGQGARRLKRGTKDLLLNVLPTDIPERPPDPEPASPMPLGARALVLAVMIIPLIVLFTVVMTRIQYDRARAAQFDNATAQAQYLYDQAIRQDDRELKREDLYRALEEIEQGLSLAPDHQHLQDLRRRAQHQIDQLEGVIPIYSFAKLYYFDNHAVSPTDSSRILINQKDVMVLNRGSNLLYRFFLNDVGDALQPVEANPVLIREGDTFDGVTVTDMVDLTWMASEGSQTMARFMALDRSGTLLNYDPRRGVRAQPVGNSDEWLNPQSIGSYYGNLYVLDPLMGRLLKYLPTNDEYVRPPVDYLDAALGVDLTGAVDMTIDGSVYILFADGNIKKFLNGQPAEFSMRGFYGTMRSPVAIFVSGEQQADAEGYVYVADAGNKRVLQFTKDGEFMRQFRAVESEPFMEQLRGIYVDESERRMYLLSGQHLVLCSLPVVEQ